MASFVIQSAPWLPGSLVDVYPAQAWKPGYTPTGLPLTSATVAPNGTITFAGLTETARYVAFAAGRGVQFYVSEVELREALADRERIRELERGGTGSGGGSGGDLDGQTVDTGEHYRMIMLSDGTVRAIPFDAVAPPTPTGLAIVARLSSVRLTWNAAPGASTYRVFRDAAVRASASITSFRDTAITVGSTYTYAVASVDVYGQRSPTSAPVTAFIDPASNVAPVVEISTWPAELPTNGSAIVRVNATDVNAQTLALALSVSAGAPQPTDDPSVWLLNV
jgi:hypothetical protein